MRGKIFMKIDKNIKIISFFLLLIVLMVTVTAAVSAADTNDATTLTQTNDNTINEVNEDLSTSTSLNDTTSLSNNMKQVCIKPQKVVTI